MADSGEMQSVKSRAVGGEGRRPKLLDLPHGFITQIEEADWPLVEPLGSGVRGVTVRRSGPNPYVAQIMVDRKVHYLGSFNTLESAVAARQAAELEHWGELCP